MLVGIIATILLITYIVLDAVYDQDMWNGNTTLTVYWQAHRKSGEEAMFQAFSYFIYVVPGIAGLGFLFLNDELGVLMYGSMIAVTTGINNTLKNIYHQPRPFMVETNIDAIQCGKEYGKPSGHAMTSFVMMLLMPAILYPGIYWHQKTKPNYAWWIRVVVILILTGIVVATGMARVFLGVHTFGQVILGWVYSCYICVMYMCYIHERAYKYITEALKPDGENFSNFFIICINLFMVFWILFNILWLELDKQVFVTQKELNFWLAQVNSCSSKQLTATSPSFLYNSCFVQSFVFYVPMGAFLGARFIRGTYQEGHFSKHYSILSVKQKICRILLLIPVAIPIIPFIFVNTSQVYVQGFIQIFIICYFGGFLILALYPYLLKKAHLNLPGDLVYLASSIQQNQQIEQRNEVDIELKSKDPVVVDSQQ